MVIEAAFVEGRLQPKPKGCCKPRFRSGNKNQKDQGKLHPNRLVPSQKFHFRAKIFRKKTSHSKAIHRGQVVPKRLAPQAKNSTSEQRFSERKPHTLKQHSEGKLRPKGLGPKPKIPLQGKVSQQENFTTYSNMAKTSCAMQVCPKWRLVSKKAASIRAAWMCWGPPWMLLAARQSRDSSVGRASD